MSQHSPSLLRRIGAGLIFVPWIIGQVVSATAVVITDALRPVSQAAPDILALPLRVSHDWEITTFATAITMTPGTMTIGIRQRPDGTREFLVHVVYCADPEAVVADLRAMEEKVAPWVAGQDPAQFPPLEEA